MHDHIRNDHEDLLESLVGGKLPRNLSWSAVVDLIGQIGEVEPHGNDEFAFVVGSQRGFFKRPSTHNLEVEEISRLRSFLKEAGALGKPAKAHQIGRMVVVIDIKSPIFTTISGAAVLKMKSASNRMILSVSSII